ncbi:hypothetical protein BFO01nite_22850 [Brevibacillus formosus]|uniref:Uncharacterized protein n=1 Tax=Brevibacillus formosus TaxID=54913 RepID=A0ABQ0T488_9BACL|nr:hypothetical protein BFO01nite_22850 [Brevibacillus formosus]
MQQTNSIYFVKKVLAFLADDKRPHFRYSEKTAYFLGGVVINLTMSASLAAVDTS